jgi:hypothetical protein
MSAGFEVRGARKMINYSNYSLNIEALGVGGGHNFGP